MLQTHILPLNREGGRQVCKKARIPKCASLSQRHMVVNTFIKVSGGVLFVVIGNKIDAIIGSSIEASFRVGIISAFHSAVMWCVVINVNTRSSKQTNSTPGICMVLEWADIFTCASSDSGSINVNACRRD